ncbi:MAG TPA: aminotransferase class V-fold PLP-dependent enzyme [Polyangia bacterium]|nr:aminotransferase class V-fold PLP-dependent enzyme [Polyangia bacterium]
MDDLLRWRAEFPALEGSVYMVSHSLGAMPRAAYDALREFADLWVKSSINAWLEAWLPEVDRAGERVGRILGAPPGSVIMLPNVSTAQSIVASCFDFDRERRKVVYTDLNFPTVSYVWKAEERRGAKVEIVRSDDGIGVPTARLLEAIDERTLIVPISHVLFRSSFVQDAAAIVARAHEVGALVLLDTYQSAGTLPLDVGALGVDMATGGSVKWLCGGPGAGYLYVRPDLLPRLRPRVTGWFAHRTPFAFEMPEQDYADGPWRMIGGTPSIAPLYQARAGAEIIAQIGVDRIREKSLRQTERLIALADRAGFRLGSPREPARRGGTVCFDFDGSGEVARELNRRKFFCDHRPQCGIRVSPHFYTTDEEVDRFMEEVDRIRKRR